jgi:hypothetical protein
MKERKLLKYRGKILANTEIDKLAETELAIAKLAFVQIYIGGDLRISFNGVPHLLYPNKASPQFSVAYFKSKKFYRIFYPYPSFLGIQKRINKETPQEVIRYLEDNVK